MIAKIAAGDIDDTSKSDNGKNATAVAFGRLGGLKGGGAKALMQRREKQFSNRALIKDRE